VRGGQFLCAVFVFERLVLDFRARLGLALRTVFAGRALAPARDFVFLDVVREEVLFDVAEVLGFTLWEEDFAVLFAVLFVAVERFGVGLDVF
jgi:hypothetical protein